MSVLTIIRKPFYNVKDKIGLLNDNRNVKKEVERKNKREKSKQNKRQKFKNNNKEYSIIMGSVRIKPSNEIHSKDIGFFHTKIDQTLTNLGLESLKENINILVRDSYYDLVFNGKIEDSITSDSIVRFLNSIPKNFYSMEISIIKISTLNSHVFYRDSYNKVNYELVRSVEINSKNYSAKRLFSYVS